MSESSRDISQCKSSSEKGNKAILVGAKPFAMTGIDILMSENAMRGVKKEFEPARPAQNFIS